MEKTALCGLGQAASNPVTSTIRGFLSEYEAHVYDRTN
jgi:NADH:ubiquinone oxidoreductase subunit F (NADH-binding)